MFVSRSQSSACLSAALRTWAPLTCPQVSLWKWSSSHLNPFHHNLPVCFCLSAVDGTDRLCVSERAQCVPSRVLHLRQLPPDVSEQEVLSLALPFGRVSQLITLKTKNQVSANDASKVRSTQLSEFLLTCSLLLLSHCWWKCAGLCGLEPWAIQFYCTAHVLLLIGGKVK